MKTQFIKMHGLGNDFAIFDGRENPLRFTPAQIGAMADRKTGIGFDQMVVIQPPRQADTAAFFSIFNADGGEVEACGNVTRCVAALLMAEAGADTVLLETVAGQLRAWKAAGGLVSVDMGQVRLDWQDIPLAHENNTLSLPVTVGDLAGPVAVNVGNPHAVFFVPSVDAVPLEKWGPEVENHALFPKRVNVEIAEVQAPDRIRMRVWERGTGITRACGTGACAVAVAAVRRGLAHRKVRVILDGGVLDIEWREGDNHVLMTGAAEAVYRGELSEEFTTQETTGDAK